MNGHTISDLVGAVERAEQKAKYFPNRCRRCLAGNHADCEKIAELRVVTIENEQPGPCECPCRNWGGKTEDAE